jgi:diketogulonate reductase-like aldo/keto reductase
MGEDPGRHDEELAALRLGIELGMTLIDTAELYGDGATEEFVGEAITGLRDQVFLVSKVLPSNASRSGTIAACERSLRRLRTDRLDLYLLHWPGSWPLEETLEGFAALRREGKIRHWGVSNFDMTEMADLYDLPGGDDVATDQVLYNLRYRGIEYDLLPWCLERSIPIMAYSPVEQGRLLESRDLQIVARRHVATPAQIALAWVLREDGICAIPKAASVAHVRENRAALDIRLTRQDLEDLDKAFPAPGKPVPLAMH